MTETAEELVERILEELKGKPDTVVAKRIASELNQRKNLLGMPRKKLG
jgi:hypothetical protein